MILAIAHIISCSITNGTVPDEFREEKSDYTNYRPISKVGIAKIHEKVIKNQLLEYLERDKLIFYGQYGFRKS